MATDDIQSKINNVNSLFDNMISQYKSNYVNYHKNVTLSMPTLTPTSTTTTAGHVSSDSHAKDLNDELLTNYANITPNQTKYSSVLEMGDNFHETRLAAGASLEDYNELYKTTFFSIIMYLVGSASILYLMFKPKLQSV